MLATVAVVLLIVSFQAARRAEARMQAAGTLAGGHFTGARLWVYSSLHGHGTSPCWIFRYEELESDHEHYFSLTGKFLSFRSSWRPLDGQAAEWESIGESRHGYLAESKYRDLALDYLRKQPPENTDLSHFDLAVSLPMIARGASLPKRVRDVVMLPFGQKKEFVIYQTNGYAPIQFLHVFMDKAGNVLTARVERCWQQKEQVPIADDQTHIHP